MLYRRRLAPNFAELCNPLLAYGPRKNILLKLSNTNAKRDLIDLCIYKRLVEQSVLFERLRRLRWSDLKRRFYDPLTTKKIDLQNQFMAVLDVLLSF